MKGWQIFVHSVRLVFRNIDNALRVSLVLYLVQVAYQVFQFRNPPVPMEMDGVTVPVMDPALILPNLLYGLAAVVASLWVAVAWHRYVLAEEYPRGWVPVWHGGYLLGYLGRSVLIGLIIVIAAVAASLPLGIIAMGLPGLAVLVGLAIVVLAVYIFLRLGAILPAAAIGERLTLGEAWAATKGESGTILTLALIGAGVSLIVQLPTLVAGPEATVLNLVYGLVVNWFATMIGISVLTTFYGHYIEKRAID